MRGRPTLAALLAACSSLSCGGAPEASASSDAEALSQQTVGCIQQGAMVTSATLGSVYLFATEAGIALVPATGGHSLWLAEGIGTLVSAGVLASGLGTLIACNISPEDVADELRDAGATTQADAVSPRGACDPQSSCCEEPPDETPSPPAPTPDEPQVFIDKLWLPNFLVSGWIDVWVTRMQVLDTETGRIQTMDYRISGKLVWEKNTNKKILRLEELDVRPRVLEGSKVLTYRYKPGAVAMKRVMRATAEAIAAKAPGADTLRVARERRTKGYHLERCRTKDYALPPFRNAPAKQ